MKQLILTTKFKAGDRVCSKNNLDNDFLAFFFANDYDVRKYSGKNREYYKIIDTKYDIGVDKGNYNPVSIEQVNNIKKEV